MTHRGTRALCLLAAGLTAVTAALAGTSVASAAAYRVTTPAATQYCGRACVDASSAVLGPSMIASADVPPGAQPPAAVGQPVTLSLGGDNPAEDFTGGFAGTVRAFCAAWPARQSFGPASFLCRRYPTLPVYQLAWAPLRSASGLCAGVAAATAGTVITLSDCGASDRTLWIGDRPHGPGHDCRAAGRYCPWLNGAGRNLLAPLALTVNPGSAHPADRLSLQREQLLAGGVAADTQQFMTRRGPSSAP